MKKPSSRQDRNRPVKIPTAQSLGNIALFYLSRYAASEFSLRRVLENRLRRAAARNPLFAGDGEMQERLRAAIDAIIEKHKRTGVLDDAAYAGMKTASLRRSGRSAREIRQRLKHRGIGFPAIDQALAQNAEDENAEQAELKAAMILARRRRLGPFRKSAAGPEQRRKELAAMARAGFSLDIARRVLNAKADDGTDVF